MLRSLQIADQIARTGHMPVRRLDLIWISARNAARRELDLGVAALVEAVTLLTADVEGSTRLSQTRLNELAADYPTLDQNISESTKAVSGTISPLFSARSMNRPGSSVPNVGCSQRSRASAPMMRLSASRMIGW